MTHRDDLAWMDDAMCVAMGPRRWDLQPAEVKAHICAGCRVRLSCIQYMADDGGRAEHAENTAVTADAAGPDTGRRRGGRDEGRGRVSALAVGP